MNHQLNEFQLDQLKEIVNIGASHASTALSQMINKKVGLTVPKAYIDKIEKVGKMIPSGDEKITAALLKIFGDANGVMFFMFTNGCDVKLAKLLTKNTNETGVMTEMELSSIKEVGNVLAGACLSAFSKFLNMNLLHSVSNIAVDSISSIINSVAIEVGKNTGEALIFEVDFDIKEEDISSHLFFFIDPRATDKILDAIEKKYSS